MDVKFFGVYRQAPHIPERIERKHSESLWPHPIYLVKLPNVPLARPIDELAIVSHYLTGHLLPSPIFHLSFRLGDVGV